MTSSASRLGKDVAGVKSMLELTMCYISFIGIREVALCMLLLHYMSLSF